MAREIKHFSWSFFIYIIGNYPSSKTYVAFIDHHRLSWRDSPLGLGEFDSAFAVPDIPNSAGSIGLTITGFGGINPVAMRHPATYPCKVDSSERRPVQGRMIMALYHGEDIPSHILG